MSIIITVWRLSDRSGVQSECLLSERDGRWRLIVRRGPSVWLSERFASDDEALARSTDLWAALTKGGWKEPNH